MLHLKFLLDSFSDDIVSENRFVELNTDMIPRGHLTMTGFNIKSDEFANPNVWLRMVVENEVEIRKVIAKVRAVPITVNYDLEILLSSELDTFKCSQAIMDTLWIYKFMYFEYNFLNIDAVILMPDTNSIEMAREIEELQAKKDTFKEELKEFMIWSGRANLWNDWVKFQATARKKRAAEEARRQKLISTIMFRVGIGLIVLTVLGGIVSLIFFASFLQNL